MSDGELAVIVVGVVFVALLIVAIAVIPLYGNIRSQSSTLSSPKIVVTNTDGTYSQDCGVLGSGDTTWTFSATLVNTGASGYADVDFNVNGNRLTSNNYFVSSQSQLPISTSAMTHDCSSQAGSTYSITISQQTPA